MARFAIFSIAALSALSLAGCTATVPPADGRVHVVASTNVYGSIAESIGGELITVTSLITNAAQDPHSFEASAQDQLALSKADLVIENGGGYDPFIDTLLDAASSEPVVVTAADEAGLTDGANEHVWYDLDAVQLVAEAIARELSALDRSNVADYEQNLVAFTAELDQLRSSAAGVGEGRSVAITEPVPLYLLESSGLKNTTPEEFSEAIEEGTDVAPAVLNETLELVGDAALLAYNSQTASAETEKVRAAAEDAGVPVVEFSETLPDGADYVSWMTDNLKRIAAALRP